MEFPSFFQQATGFLPYAYQERLAKKGLPDVIKVETGCGKTEAVGLAWLWRRLHQYPSTTPRWLVYALPMRTLVDQTSQRFEHWRTNLGLSTDDLGVYRVMGGIDWKDRDWRLYPERDAVFVGTVDMLLSRALNRGFADSQWNWPISFGAFNSGCQWVFDEPQLMDASVVTGRQLQTFRDLLGTVQPTQTTWMSATIDMDRLRTVNAPEIGQVLEISPEERNAAPIADRLGAPRSIEGLGTTNDKEAAQKSLESHLPGTLTLVVVNTVKRAQAIYKVLKRQKKVPEIVLIHSRFRRSDREEIMEQVVAPIGAQGRIVVSTQVVEAGVDLSASTLLTDLAPWSSIVQRAGRCNRDGGIEEAKMYWMRPKSSAPYEDEELALAEKELRDLSGTVTPEILASRKVSQSQLPLPTLRFRDLFELFDTLPDLNGNHIDVGRFIRNSQDRDVMVAWREIKESQPFPNTFPSTDELCRVPIGELRKFAGTGRKPAMFVASPERTQVKWERVRPTDLRPNLTVIIDAAAGGYSHELGWEGASAKTPVTPLESTDTSPTGHDVAIDDDPNSMATNRPWLSLSQHLADTELAARELSNTFGTLSLSQDMICAAVMAAKYHDLGKGHKVFQDALLKTKADNDPAPPEGEILAKGGTRRGLRYKQRYFRHELVSALMLLGPEKHLLDSVAENDLVVYLAASHHGRVRLGVRRLGDEVPPDDKEGVDLALGVVDGDEVKSFVIPGGKTLGGVLALSDVGVVSGGPIPSYTARMLNLLNRKDIGPFRLAWLEMLVRLADWRASGKPGQGDPSS